MKLKNLLLFFTGCMLFASCSKDHKSPIPSTAPSTYKINYTLSGFQQTINARRSKSLQNHIVAASADSSSSDTLNVLYYVVYNSAGNYVHKVVENATPAGFAGFSDNLAAGNYNVYFFAGKTGLQLDTTKSEIFYSAPNDSLGDWHDTFYEHLALTVTGNDAETVTLSRFVSGLKINIADAIPANAVKIVTSIEDEYIYYSYLHTTQTSGFTSPYTKTLTTLITPAMVSKTNLQQYTILSQNYVGSSVTVVISCYDAADNTIGSVTIPLVTLQPNQETILSGKLFGATPTGTNFSISVNNSWDPGQTNTIAF